MKANLKIDQKDLLALFSHTKGAYGNMTFLTWSKECLSSYITYFNNKALFNNKKYTYSEFVNAQILAILFSNK
tara:strand:+ start:101 stop:319 length:219 start_codon:yes stop_codon:yes gene_type:complete